MNCVFNTLRRSVRASSTQNAGSLQCQRSCTTSGPVKSFYKSVSASCGTCKTPAVQNHLPQPEPRGPEPRLNSACKCSILKFFFCLYLILDFVSSFQCIYLVSEVWNQSSYICIILLLLTSLSVHEFLFRYTLASKAVKCGALLLTLQCTVSTKSRYLCISVISDKKHNLLFFRPNGQIITFSI